MSYSFFSVYEHIIGSDSYTESFQIQEHNVIEYTYMQADFPNYDTLDMKLKPTTQIESLVGNTFTDIKAQRPLILAKVQPSETGNIILWFSFIVQRERRISDVEDVVYFKGVDFKFFDTKKIVPSNFGWEWGSIDPDNPPEDFKKVRYTRSYDNIMNVLYDVCYINPNRIVNGEEIWSGASWRKFYGLASHSSSTGLVGTKTFSSAQSVLSDLIDELNNLFGYESVFKQRLLSNGKIQISHEAPIEIDQQIVNTRTQIKEVIYGTNVAYNHIIGFAKPQLYTFLVNYSRYWEFTSIEKEEDFTFIAGNNSNYLTNPTQTSMRKEERLRKYKYHKIEIKDQFLIFNVGNIVRIDGIRYRIRKIQETKSSSTFTVDVDIEEVE